MVKKYIKFIALTFFVGVFSISVQAQKTVLRYAIQNPESHVSAMAAKEFGRVLKEKTNNEVSIQLYAGGQLGKVKEVVQNLQLGAIDITIVRPGYLADLGTPKFNALSLPYIFSNNEHQDAVLFGKVGRDILDTLGKIKIKGVGYYRDLPRHFFFTKKPVKTVKDMKGLKIRSQTSELAVDTVKAFGAAPTPIPFSELYGALQSGVVEGGDQPLTGFYAQRYQEVAKHIILDGHDASPIIVLMAQSTWNKLNAGQQKAVMEAHKAAADKFIKINQESVDVIKAKLKADGVTIVEVKDKKPWQDATKELIEKYGARYKDTVDAIRATDK